MKSSGWLTNATLMFQIFAMVWRWRSFELSQLVVKVDQLKIRDESKCKILDTLQAQWEGFKMTSCWFGIVYVSTIVYGSFPN